MNEEQFIIIGRSTCRFCAMAQDFLSAKLIKYQFLDYNSSRAILEEYKEFYKQETVPIILSNNTNSGLVKKVGGYTDLVDYLSG